MKGVDTGQGGLKAVSGYLSLKPHANMKGNQYNKTAGFNFMPNRDKL